jgi:hypothetical protein
MYPLVNFHYPITIEEIYPNFVPAIRKKEIKEGIRYIQKHRKTDENLYIYSHALLTFNYYERIGFVNMDVQVVKAKPCNNKEDYMDELSQLQGKFWLLFVEVYDGEEDFIIDKLDSMGCRKMDELRTRGSSVYLFDFSTINNLNNNK